MKFKKFKKNMREVEQLVFVLGFPLWLLLMTWWFHEAGANNEQSLIIIWGIPICLIAAFIVSGLIIGLLRIVTWVVKLTAPK